MNYKDTEPYLSAFFAAFCLTDFIDCMERLSLMVDIFDPACELFPPWTKEIYLRIVAPLLYLLFDLLPLRPWWERLLSKKGVFETMCLIYIMFTKSTT